MMPSQRFISIIIEKKKNSKYWLLSANHSSVSNKSFPVIFVVSCHDIPFISFHNAFTNDDEDEDEKEEEPHKLKLFFSFV